MKNKQFILYDDRAADGTGTENAAVLEVCDDNEEALECRGDYGGMACYSYTVKEMPGDEPDQLVDEKFEWNWFPN